MSKPKYYYGIVNKKTGHFLIESGNLPIFWSKRIALGRLSVFDMKKYGICRFNISDIDNLIIRPE